MNVPVVSIAGAADSQRMSQAEDLPMQRKKIDEVIAARVVALALDNATRGQLPFGALVVRESAVLGTGVNTVLRDHDPTAHAEVAAVRAACQTGATLQLPGSTLVSSCEPCAMCHAAALVAGVARIIYAAPKEAVPDLGVPFPEVVAEMQAEWRRAGSNPIEYIPTTGADEPFARYLAEVGLTP
jgi:guanine deaminase